MISFLCVQIIIQQVLFPTCSPAPTDNGKVQKATADAGCCY